MSRAYLLDTCAFLKAVTDEGKHLGREARRLILNGSNHCLLSAVSIAEMGILSSIGRLKLSPVALRQLIEDLDVMVIPYRADHALRYFSLPPPEETHRDPHDRMLIATALTEQVPILTSDTEFKKYAGLKVIW
jgi:PIN domain nuclease of toxin-antitoxin system